MPDPRENVVKWLHLSDLHLAHDTRWLWQWLKAHLFRDLEALHPKSGPWDLVLFTGDLTRRGEAQEFAAVDRVLGELWAFIETLQPGHRPILLSVPGNHDLVRPVGGPSGPEYWDEHPADSLWRGGAEDAADERRTASRSLVRAAFANYSAWWDKSPYRPASGLKAGLYPGDFAATLEIRGLRLGVAGLNTALVQLTAGDYEGKLSVHPLQFYRACADDDGPGWARGHDACLLLTHHPTTWLNAESLDQFDGCIADQGRFPAHLFGHLHEVGTSVTSSAGLSLRARWQSSALMGTEEILVRGRRQARPCYGYAAGELACDRGEVRVRFWPRRASKLGGGTPKLGAGEWHFAGAHDRIKLGEDGASEWLPVGHGCSRDREPSRPSHARACAACAWFDVVAGGRAHPGLRSEDARLLDLVPGENPYVPGVALPAGSPVFVGRQRLLRDVREALAAHERPRSISLLGERRIGKSSFLNQLFESLATEPDLVVARSTTQAWSDATPALFFRELCHALEQALSLPSTGAGADYTALRRLLRDAAPRHRFVVLIDEFDDLPSNSRLPREFYSNLRALGDDQHVRLGYLLCSRRSLADLCQESHDIKTSAFWNIFGIQHQLGLLQRADVDRLVGEVWRRSSAAPPPDLGQLQRLAGAHPAFLQIALHEAWTDARHGVPLDEAKIRRTLQDHFRSLWRHRNEAERAVLIEMCQGGAARRDGSVVGDLMARGLLDADARLFAPAFGEWVCEHARGAL
ncbi:MAG: AAA family ATPase [Polyangiaceae bacterium]|nr:AAA family ATPase [Polyangiaceae bacterium]